jgi:hypothetical protein
MIVTIDYQPNGPCRLRFNPAGTRLALSNDGDVGEVLVLDVVSGIEVARYTDLSA